MGVGNFLQCHIRRQSRHGRRIEEKKRRLHNIDFIEIKATGIAAEFCTHVVRAFALSRAKGANRRAQAALSEMGSSVRETTPMFLDSIFLF